MATQGGITVVSGLPRSGTSMMMKMIEAGGGAVLTDAVRGADEDNPQGYYEYDQVKRLKKDKSWLPLAVGKTVKVISFLLPELPDFYHYRIVFMRRNLEEVLASQRQMLMRRGEGEESMSDEAMGAVYEKHLTHIVSWLAQQSHMAVHYVDHHDILMHPDEMVGEVNRFLGGSFDEKAMALVVDPRLHRQRLGV